MIPNIVTKINVSDDYMKDAIGAAENHASGLALGSEEQDLLDFMHTLVQEVYRQRGRIAFLEGWKEATEASLDGSKNTR